MRLCFENNKLKFINVYYCLLLFIIVYYSLLSSLLLIIAYYCLIFLNPFFIQQDFNFNKKYQNFALFLYKKKVYPEAFVCGICYPKILELYRPVS